MLRRMRWLLISKILAGCRPLGNTNLPLFSRYFTCIDVVIFLILARLRRTMFFQRLVLATEVAFVMMVRVMDALSVVVVAIAAARLAIFGVIAGQGRGKVCR